MLRQNKPHEQIETITNHGPLCNRIKSDKENILKSTVCKRQRIYTWCVSKVLQYVSTQKIRQEYKVCELRYRPIGAMFFTQLYNLLFSVSNKNIIFDTHHLLFQNQQFFLVIPFKLIDTIKTIFVRIELQLNSTVIT